jgi:PAS domain S-box-containing protein
MPDHGQASQPSWEGEMFRLLVENVRDYALFVVDAEGRVQTWTPGAERLLGYEQDEILGQSADRFFTPEDIQNGIPYQERHKTLTTGRGEEERWHVRKDGSRFWANSIMTPLRGEGGEVRGFAKLMRDRTDWKRAERARQESEARRAAVLETSLDAIITIDHHGNVLDFNPAAERLFGYTRAGVQGRKIAGLIVPARLRDAHHRGMERYLATGEGPVLGKRIEMPALRADGTEFPVELTVTRILLDDPPRFTAYLRDLSERERAESRRSVRLAVTQTLAEAATLQEAAPRILQAICEGLAWDVGAFWTLDRRANVLRCLDVWDRPQVQIRGFKTLTRQRTFEPNVGLPGRVWSSSRPAWIPDVTRDANFPRAAVAAQEGLHGAFACPVLLGPDVLGVIEFFSRQLREPDADLLEMMATVGGQIGQFIERKRAEEAVRDSEQRFARFMQHLPGLAWIKDLQGRYVYANDAAEKAFRKPRAELYGKTDDEVFPAATAAKFRKHDQQALASAAGVKVIETLEHEGGVVHHSLVSKFPIPEPNGSHALVGGMAIDITDRLRAEEALREADRLKDEFLAMLAHELRNPLAPIRNALHILRQPGVSGSALENVHAMAERQVQHMARLLDDLLDMSRISRGLIELRREAVDLKPLANRTAEAVRPLAEQRRHQLTVTLAEDLLRVEGDPTRLEQIITNLLTNACKYTEPGGLVRLTVGREGGEVVLRVQDNGIGIAPEMLPRIFDLFVQAERRLDRSQGGVGIGLTLVKRLVELHGGSIAASSPGLGQGSEFVVRLPARADAGAATERELGTTPTHRLPRRRVLVVDDNQDAADSLALLLRLLGQDVGTAYDGPTALAQAGEFRPELVFLDLGMPGMDGYEVARRLRRQPPSVGVVLVALTGWGQEEDRRRSSEAGFDHHLVKPVEPDAVEKVLAGYRRMTP